MVCESTLDLLPASKLKVSVLQSGPWQPLFAGGFSLRKFAPVLFVLVMSFVWAQEMSHRLSNQDIIDMTALGLSEDVIITKIHSAPKPEDLAFDTSTAGLKNLKLAHVSDAVIKVMINPAAPPPPAPAVGPVSDPNLPPQE